MIKHIVVPRLYFNKTLEEYESSLHRNWATLARMQLCDVDVRKTKGLAVDMARYYVVMDVLTKGYDAICWLDTDMVFPDDAVARLVQHMNEGHMIVGGLYRKALPPYRLLTELSWGKEANHRELLNLAKSNKHGVVPVSMTAGGFTLVHMDVYHKIAEKFGPPWYCNWDFVTGDGMVGEDRFFTKRATECGFQPVVDPTLMAVHWPPGTNPVPVIDDQPELKWCLP